MTMLNPLIFCALFSWALMVSAAPLSQEPITPVPNPDTSHPEEVELGQILFHDVRLSKGDQLSCASCHSLSRYGGADGQKVSTGVDGQQGNINSPSVFNASLNFSQFWNGRAANLMEQIDGPIHNPREMGSNWDEIVKKLSKDGFYQLKFKHLYSEGLSANTIGCNTKKLQN